MDSKVDGSIDGLYSVSYAFGCLAWISQDIGYGVFGNVILWSG